MLSDGLGRMHFDANLAPSRESEFLLETNCRKQFNPSAHGISSAAHKIGLGALSRS